jgi:hypothetical protein
VIKMYDIFMSGFKSNFVSSGITVHDIFVYGFQT